jgi:hypothetical protein
MARPLYLVTSMLVIGAIVFTALSFLDTGARASERRVERFPAADTLRVAPAAGDVRVTGADVEGIEVVMRLTSGLSSPRVRTELRDGTLVLEDDCPGVVFGSCNVDYEVRVPRDVAVLVDSGAGDVEAANLTAGVDLESSAGSVEVRDVSGPQVRLSSSAGDVTGERLAASTVDATSSAGDVDLDFTRAPDRVAADSSAGDVRVLLPGGAYAVDAETSAGDEDVSVPQDSSSPRTVRVRSSAGDVEVTPR